MQQIIEEINKSDLTYKDYWLNLLNRNLKNKAKYQLITQDILNQIATHNKRRQLLASLKFYYPENLPVSQQIDKLKQLVMDNQVVIICGETGSGKTTQLPKMLLELGLARRGIIGHTQPRRIAAKLLAHRISSELGDETAQIIAYKMRFNDKTSMATSLKLMTDGILLQEIQNDRLLLQYSALIIDEVHERSLNIDFILGYLKALLSKRPDLKIIITSATIENTKLTSFFANSVSCAVSGKTFPVDIIYQPYNEDEEDTSLNQAIYQAIEASLAVEMGNGLVFLPGEKEIKSCLNYLRKTNLKTYEILPLFSKQSSEEQGLVFRSNGRLKIILSTNIAETSLTIPGIKFIIDSGLARVKRYNLRNRVEQLNVEPISQASSQQRAGRAGRVSHGLCVRLFSESEFLSRRQFTEPELLRSNLANVILKLLLFKLGDARAFEFLDMPDNKAYNEGFRTLFQIGAIDERNQITPLGLMLAKLPIDVQLGKILLNAATTGCLTEALIIVAFLAIQDPREMIIEHQQLIRERHKIWYDEQSDFMQIIKLWQWYHEQLKHKKSNKKFIEVCHYHFLSALRMREWHEMHRQLKEIMLGLKFNENNLVAEYATIHKALLSGFVLNIGCKDIVENYYRGTNGRKFYVHPSSTLKLKQQWIIALSLVETTRLYGRFCAEIDPVWLRDIANHLIKFTYDQIIWSAKRGQVTATKHFLLFGLEVFQQKVPYAQIDPAYAREVLLRDGLVANNLVKRFEFINFNTNVIREIEKIEDKLRTSFAIIEDELFDFYNQVIDNAIVDITSLEYHIKQHGDSKFKIDKDKFIAKLTNDIQHQELYPEYLINNKIKLSVKYIFDHNNIYDGMNVRIQLQDLFNLKVEPFDWLVPGLIREKIMYLIKSLSKSIRLQFNPVQDTISTFLECCNINDDFISQFYQFAKERRVELDLVKLKHISYPPHLTCHFVIIKDKKVLASGDSILALQQQLVGEYENLIIPTVATVVTNYIPELQNLLKQTKQNGLIGYTALFFNPKQQQIELCTIPNLTKAKIITQKGLIELFRLQLVEQIRYLRNKKIMRFNEIALALRNEYKADELGVVFERFIIDNSIIRNLPENFSFNHEQFSLTLDKIKHTITQITMQFSNVMLNITNLYQQIKTKLIRHPLNDEINIQLDWLIYPQFLSKLKLGHLTNYPRYLQAIVSRLDKYTKLGLIKDEQLSSQINEVFDLWYDYIEDLEAKNITISQEMHEFYYKIEELRISLFAPEIKTLFVVSVKRLVKELEELYRNDLISAR